MIGLRKLEKNVPFSPAWGALIVVFLMAVYLPGRGFAQLRDEEFIRRHAPPYIARFQKDLEAWQRYWHQGTGERVALLVRLSRVCFNLGELAEHGQRAAYYEKGKYFAQILVTEQPARVEGHYWLGVNLGGLAEVGGAGRALRLLPEIVETLTKAALLDPAYDQAGTHRALGSIFCEAPPWPISVGNLDKALHHLTLAVCIAPKNSTNRLYLGYTLMRFGRLSEARAELQRVFQATANTVWLPGVEHDRREARSLLKKLENSK